MEIKFLNRNIFQRIFGIPATPKFNHPDCWHFSDGKLTVDLKKVPELDKPGGAIRVEGRDLPRRILVVHGEDGNYHVFQNRCTHMGHRRLDPVPGTNTVQCCSVNKSTYDYAGTKIHGPAPKPITTYPVIVENDKLIASLS
ncbi:MAG: Rieske (2Fe-2S) protein [Deltaproteobacteria bacterium]|nr:MAG: Rieske (2Fe-2S) protein [Deltaproteobacteria bacterium]